MSVTWINWLLVSANGEKRNQNIKWKRSKKLSFMLAQSDPIKRRTLYHKSSSFRRSTEQPNKMKIVVAVVFSVVHDLALHGEAPPGRDGTPERRNQSRSSDIRRRNSVSVCETPTRLSKQNSETSTRSQFQPIPWRLVTKKLDRFKGWEQDFAIVKMSSFLVLSAYRMLMTLWSMQIAKTKERNPDKEIETTCRTKCKK